MHRSHRLEPIKIVLLVIIIFVTVTTARPAVAEPTLPPPATSIDWLGCGDGLQCGTLEVPLDWRSPTTDTISLGMARLPAANQATKRGSLLINLGGPGESVDSFRRSLGQFTELRQWYDLVVFDPRGFGGSGGVTCPTQLPELGTFQSGPLTAWRSMMRANQAFARDCEDAMGKLAGQLDARQVAHDMEAIRTALGEPRLNYFGNSYGTMYGQAYAELFPRKVARMYLDSVRDHTQTSAYRHHAPIVRQIRELLPRINEWCDREPDCALHGQSVLAVWDRVHAAADRSPIPGTGTDQVLTAGMLRGLGQMLVSEETWPMITEALASLDRGDAGPLLNQPPMEDPKRQDAQAQAQCADFPAPSYGRTARLMKRLKAIEPRFAWQTHIGSEAWCIGHRPATYPPRPITAHGLPPVLLANGLYDTATAPSEGQHVAAQLPGAGWFGATGTHSLYQWSGSRCVRDIVHDYLATGVVPPEGTVCDA